MKPWRSHFLGEFAVVSVPTLWVQVFSLLMPFVLMFLKLVLIKSESFQTLKGTEHADDRTSPVKERGERKKARVN